MTPVPTPPATGDTPATPNPEATPPAPVATPAAPAAPDADAAVLAAAQNPDAVKRALEAERSAAKAARDEAEAVKAALKQYQDAEKSETERLTERATTAEEIAATATSKLMRLEIALDKGLPPALAERLQGATREAMEADADALLALVPSGATPPVPPAGSFDGGPKPPVSEKSLDERIAAAEVAGDWQAVSRLNAEKLIALRATG